MSGVETCKSRDPSFAGTTPSYGVSSQWREKLQNRPMASALLPTPEPLISPHRKSRLLNCHAKSTEMRIADCGVHCIRTLGIVFGLHCHHYHRYLHGPVRLMKHPGIYPSSDDARYSGVRRIRTTQFTY